MGRFARIALVTLLAAGCATKRSGYDVPAVPLPDQYQDSLRHPEKDKPSTDQEAARHAELSDWWRIFGSRELNELVDRGLANNPDMRVATLRLAQTKARATQAKAGQLPTITAPALIGKGSVPVGTGVTQSQRSVQGSLRGDWRVDVWGEQSALAESAEFQLWRAAFERDNVERNLVANLVATYVEYASLNDRLRLARENETILNETLVSIEKRVAVGDATMSDLEQQRAAIFAIRASIPGLERQREDARNSMAFLVGTVPGSLRLSDEGLEKLRLPMIHAGLPSALLLRRPDVRMAEARLLSADADIDVARARLFPSLDLSAQAGYSGAFLAQFFQPQNLFWNVLASLTATIFDNGRRASEEEYSQALHEETLELYVRTIYQALREAEGSLSSIRLAQRRFEAQKEATGAAQRALDINRKVYTMGGVDYLTLLDNQRTYHRYLDDYEQARLDHYRGYINLFQALGGGIDSSAALPGKGGRPTMSVDASPGMDAEPVAKPVTVEGVDWVAPEAAAATPDLQIETFWQVELPGLYHRSTIGAAWRDLRSRYPLFMEGRILRPRLNGKIESGANEKQAWYRLYVAKFASDQAARTFCAALQADQQRCRVVSSRQEDAAASAGLKASDSATTEVAPRTGP